MLVAAKRLDQILGRLGAGFTGAGSRRYLLDQTNPRLRAFFGYAEYLVFEYDNSGISLSVQREDAKAIRVATYREEAIRFFVATDAIGDSYVTADGYGAVLTGNNGLELKVQREGSVPDWENDIFN